MGSPQPVARDSSGRSALVSTIDGSPDSLDGLRREVDRVGPVAYLLTVTPNGAPHAVSVRIGWEDDLLVLSPGSKSLANAAVQPHVTLLWPPAEWGYYSLILDAVVVSTSGTGHGDNRTTLRPRRAVLHPTVTTTTGDRIGPGCVPIFQPAVTGVGTSTYPDVVSHRTGTNRTPS
jgi:hypothetical protein